MQHSQYAQDMSHILASLQQDGNEAEDTQPLGKEEEIIHHYPGSIGGIDVIITSKQPIPPEYLTSDTSEVDDQAEPVIDSNAPATLPRKAPPLFLLFCFILSMFVLLDVADNQLIALLTPTVTVAITPTVRTVSLTSSTQQGKLLSPITVSQSLTVPATGHGHQDARDATGTLTFYNGLFTSQFVPQGTVFTGSDGIQIATDEAVTIPANTPPVDGQATVTAHALNVGESGNIAPGDIDVATNSGLLVKNLQFTNGQDERDFHIVRAEDVTNAAGTLKAKVSQSMTAALNGQLMPGQELQPTPCNPTVTASNAPGDEAQSVTVTVAQRCTAIAYNSQELTSQATKLLAAQVVKTVGQGYILSSDVKLTITKADTTTRIVTLSFTAQATYIFQLTTTEQQRMVRHIQGENRLTALRELSALAGIRHVSITGVTDNNLIPDDPGHIHIFIVLFP